MIRLRHLKEGLFYLAPMAAKYKRFYFLGHVKKVAMCKKRGGGRQKGRNKEINS
jgi:hypothetical protein